MDRRSRDWSPAFPARQGAVGEKHGRWPITREPGRVRGILNCVGRVLIPRNSPQSRGSMELLAPARKRPRLALAINVRHSVTYRLPKQSHLRIAAFLRSTSAAAQHTACSRARRRVHCRAKKRYRLRVAPGRRRTAITAPQSHRSP